MENLEQENHKLCEEVTALRTGMANLTALVESLVATQNQPPPPPPPHATQPQQATVISEITIVPISVAPNTIAAQHRMPPGYPWGMPKGYTPEGYNPTPHIAQSAQ